MPATCAAAMAGKSLKTLHIRTEGDFFCPTSARGRRELSFAAISTPVFVFQPIVESISAGSLAMGAAERVIFCPASGSLLLRAEADANRHRHDAPVPQDIAPEFASRT
jgi:hypothetical protein